MHEDLGDLDMAVTPLRNRSSGSAEAPIRLQSPDACKSLVIRRDVSINRLC